MIAAIKQAGGEPKYDEYPGVGHNSWDKAYANPELYKWLLSHSRK
jgi:predicted peptidase